MDKDLENFENFYKLFNDIIIYIINNVCDYYKIKHFNKYIINKLNDDTFIINNILKYDIYNNIFEFDNKKYKPKFNKHNYVLEIFQRLIYYEIYNNMTWNDLNQIIEELSEYYNLNYEINGELLIEKMIKDIYKMMI